MLKVKIKAERHNARLPEGATPGAGCYDVYACQIIYPEEQGKVVVKLGFSAEFPPDYVMELVPRSSITKSRFILQNSPGQGDSDYRKEYEMRFIGIPEITVHQETNQLQISTGTFPYKPGERVGQIYFRKKETVEFEWTKELSESSRDGGFGSTGNGNIA